ncbi:aliphatic sulfonate ABC transporter substrate-binding protein [Nesterenkonia populi]
MPTSFSRSAQSVTALGAAALLALSACGDDSDGELDTLNIDFATYNPLSLVILEHGWLEEELEELGTDVTWIQSHGSNRANEMLRADELHVGSTAGSAALLNRSVGADVHTFYVESQPEWAALVARPDSGIEGPEDLEGASVAATLATDPFFFLARSLEEAGLSLDDVEVQALQHADGRQAMENGDVDAWMGLDPIMGDAELAGAELVHRDIDFNTFSTVNATADFLEDYPEVAQTVVNVYEQARQWAVENPDETAEILAEHAGIELDVAELVISERVNFDISPVPGDDLHTSLEPVAPFFVETGDVDSEEQVQDALDELFWPEYAEEAEATDAEGADDAAEQAEIEEDEDA